MKSKEELKKYFENGDKPTQEQFWEWQDSYWHKDEKLENIVPLTGTENGENVTGKITSEAATVFVADWGNIESESRARLAQDEGFIIETFRKNVQLKSDNLKFTDNSSNEKGVLLSIDTNTGVTANKLFDLVSHYQFVQQLHIQDGYYTKSQIDSMVERLYKIKGSVPDFASLPSSENTLGDVYNLSDTGDNYVWADHNNGIGYWDKLSGLYDLSSYATESYVNDKLGADEGGVWNFPI
ncbi:MULTISPECIES: hypothetical protein [Chryseobacterium]|uniref:hypothetical protein n=1 Tax=Chryseobacterium TaxID=59732 RepID=UPI00156902ED|nr:MULTISPECIES: hypothetical protein [Chryseobacterium]NRQ45780.1 hypothetical protein [Chryseobacterium sp. C-204]